MPVDEAWLDGGKQISAAVLLTANNIMEDKAANTTRGPIINIVPVPPTPPLPAPPPTSINTLGLAVGLPVAFAAIVFIIAVLYFGMRKTRRIGLGSVMGRRKGYGVKKSRTQRMGRKGPVGLSEQEIYSSDPGFRDDPVDDDVELSHGRYEDSTREDRSRSAGNVFREELARQGRI